MADPDPDLLIELDDVTVRRGETVLVGPIDWRVELDERWVVLGPNGAGKTTLLALASGQLFPTTGTAHVLGETLGRVDIAELRPRIGVSSASFAARVPVDEVVADLVVSAGYGVVGRWRERYDEMDTERATELLDSLGIAHLATRSFGTLSEGERKRVLVARALMTDPELLLLDEPAAGLDLGGREDLVARLSVLAADPDAPATVLVTHHVEEIPPDFSHALLLRDGRVVAAGLLADVITEDALSETFDTPIALEHVAGSVLRQAGGSTGRSAMTAADDAALERWRSERRRLIRTHHPDVGGSAASLEAALAAHELNRPGARPTSTIVVTSSRRSVARRRVRHAVRDVRTRLPKGFPGASRPIDL